MTDDMLHVMEWHNGDKDFSPFSDAEMTRRQDDVRKWMADNNVDAALFTSYHCINYYSGWLYCYFGRKYGMVITHDNATTISAGIDGGQPWRRSFGNNITYTDWRRDNFYRAVRQLTPGSSGWESSSTMSILTTARRLKRLCLGWSSWISRSRRCGCVRLSQLKSTR